MASITLSGTLLDPGGFFAIGDKIRFTHETNTGKVVKSSITEITIPTSGSYLIELQYGMVRIDYQDVKSSTYTRIGSVTVNQDSTATTIPELLLSTVPPTDEQLLEFQELLQDCKDQVDLAEGFADDAEQAVTDIDALTGQQTTTELINSSTVYDADKVLETSGFATAGDGGAGKWKQNGVTGQTPSQTPAQLGDALLNDANGNQWELVNGALFSQQVGAVLDGVTDNENINDILVAYYERTGKTCYLGVGTYLSGQLVLSDKKLRLYGLGQDQSIYKLKPSTSVNCFQTTGPNAAAELYLRDITINQNGATQSAGHGIRSANCAVIDLENVRITDCSFYGIGLQAGTSNGCNWRNITIDNCGSDCIDIKDYNNNNGPIRINGLTAKNYGFDSATSPAVDARGEVICTNFDIELSGSNHGIRFRAGGPQGRAGFGSYTNGSMKGKDGDILNSSIGVRFASEQAKALAANISITNVGIAISQSSTSLGGTVSGIVANEIFGTHCILIAGEKFNMLNCEIENTSASSRVFDVEATAKDALISGCRLIDNSGNPSSARIQAAQNTVIKNNIIYGGTIGDSGTNSVIDVIYL